MTEFGFIDSIKTLFAPLPDNGFEGIGDDCSVLSVGGGESLVFTADLLTEGVHFLRTATSPRELGRKSLAVNLSDVAAMGARPVATLLSIALPADAADAWAAEFMLGYRELSEEFGVTLAGGDTTRSAAGITINVTAIGRIADAHVGHPGSRLGGHPLADHRRGALRNSRRNVVVAVALRPRHGEEAVARLHRPRIVGQSGDRRRAVAVQRPDRRIFQQFKKFLHFISMLYSPPSPARCGFRRRCFAVSRPPAP